MQRSIAPRRMIVPGLALAMSGCFLVTGLENESSSNASTSNTSTTSSMNASTTDASASSGQGGANGSSSSSGSGEGGSGGMAPVAYVRTFEGLRFESFVAHDESVYVAGTKEPFVVSLDGIDLSNLRSMFVASFSKATGMAQWVKELHSYSDAGDPRSISLAIGSERLIIGTTTTAGMWIETSELDGSGNLAALATCTNPGALPDFYRNVALATLGTEIAIAFNTAARAGMVTISCSPFGPSETIGVGGASEEVILVTYDGTFTNFLDVSALNAERDSRPAVAYTTLGGTKRIAISFERGVVSPEAFLGMAARDASPQTTLFTVPFSLGPLLGGLGEVSLGGTDQFALVTGGVRDFEMLGPVPPGSGLLRAKLVADGNLAPAPRKLDYDGLNDATPAGLLVGKSVRIEGDRAITSGYASDAHKLGTTFPPEGVKIGTNTQRSMFFADFAAASFDVVDHAIALPLGPKTLDVEHVVQASVLPEGIIAGGVIPNDAILCGQPCGAFSSTGERGCAFLLRQPFVDLVQAGGEPRVAAGCYTQP